MQQPSVDVLYVAALDEDELEVAKAIAGGPFLGHPGVANWIEHDVDDATPYERGDFDLADGSSFSVAITSQLRMGAESASRTLATLIERLHPRCLAMSGVCAGRPGSAALGDVIVAETAYFAAEGKKVADGLRPDIRTQSMPVKWLLAAKRMRAAGLPSYAEPTSRDSEDWFLETLLRGSDPQDQPERGTYIGAHQWTRFVEELIAKGLIRRNAKHRPVLTPEGRRQAGARRYDNPDGPLNLPFAIRVGPVTSEPWVDASNPWEVVTTSGVRTVIGLEMEAASVAASAWALDVTNWVVAKGVMDHADGSKNDSYKGFAARASAEVVWGFLIDRRLKEPASILSGTDDQAAFHSAGPKASDPVLPPSNLKRRGNSFVDRVTEQNECSGLLRDGSTRLITIFGPPGAGKTRLALEVGTNLREFFDDHVYVVDLSSVADPDLLFASITEVLKVDAGDPLIDALREVFRGVPSLLILENFERVGRAATRVSDLLAVAPELRIMVTSDAPLDLTTERRLEARRLAGGDGLELFLDRAQQEVDDPGIRQDIIELTESLMGLPLAIELVAARARTSSVAELRKLLRSPDFIRLENLMQDVPDRQRSLQRAIGWSFDLLEPAQQKVFLRLSVFEGSWTERAGAALVGDLVDSRLAIEWMQPLLDRRFVVRDEERASDRQPRYSIFFAMRDYGRHRLAQDVEHERRVRAMHADFYRDLVEGQGERMAGRDRRDALEELSLDHENIHAALRFFVETADRHSALRVATMLDGYWWSRNYAEGYAHLQTVLGLGQPAVGSEGAERLLWGKVCLAAGKLAIRQFDLEEASSLFTAAADAGRAEFDSGLLALSLERGALVDLELNRYEQAYAALTEAQTIYETLGGRTRAEGMADCEDGLGLVASERRDYAAANAHFERALGFYAEYSDPQLSAWVRSDQSQVAYLNGDPLMARVHAEYAQHVGRAYEDLGLLTWSANSLGHIAAFQGDLDAARNHFVESMTLAMLQGNLRPRLRALEGLAVVAARSQQDESALILLSAVDRERKHRGLPRAVSETQLIGSALASSRSRLSELEIKRAADIGMLTSLDQATELAREV